jgi:hypothetical protein
MVGGDNGNYFFLGFGFSFGSTTGFGAQTSDAAFLIPRSQAFAAKLPLGCGFGGNLA